MLSLLDFTFLSFRPGTSVGRSNSFESQLLTGMFYHCRVPTTIVNGYQLLCDAHTVLEPHRGTAALKKNFTIVLFHFFFLCVFHSDSPISFLLCLFSLC